MATQFHVAVFCSETAYEERRAFYTLLFGEPYSGEINDGSEGHRYNGSIWNKDGLCFGLLINPDLAGPIETLAHIGMIFDKSVAFNAELQRRSIDLNGINVLSGGERQIFVPDISNSGVEWEISCTELTNNPRL